MRLALPQDVRWSPQRHQRVEDLHTLQPPACPAHRPPRVERTVCIACENVLCLGFVGSVCWCSEACIMESDRRFASLCVADGLRRCAWPPVWYAAAQRSGRWPGAGVWQSMQREPMTWGVCSCPGNMCPGERRPAHAWSGRAVFLSCMQRAGGRRTRERRSGAEAAAVRGCSRHSCLCQHVDAAGAPGTTHKKMVTGTQNRN